MVKIYGISNCDIIKKAASWFKKNNVPFGFHDYKKEGISAAKLQQWSKEKGWETIFNKRSTTWKEIMHEHNGNVTNAADAIKIMQQHNSIIKRPVVETGYEIIVGYDEAKYIEKIAVSH